MPKQFSSTGHCLEKESEPVVLPCLQRDVLLSRIEPLTPRRLPAGLIRPQPFIWSTHPFSWWSPCGPCSAAHPSRCRAQDRSKSVQMFIMPRLMLQNEMHTDSLGALEVAKTLLLPNEGFCNSSMTGRTVAHRKTYDAHHSEPLIVDYSQWYGQLPKR